MLESVNAATRDAPIRVFGADHRNQNRPISDRRVGGGYGDLPFKVLYCVAEFPLAGNYRTITGNTC